LCLEAVVPPRRQAAIARPRKDKAGTQGCQAGSIPHRVQSTALKGHETWNPKEFYLEQKKDYPMGTAAEPFWDRFLPESVCRIAMVFLVTFKVERKLLGQDVRCFQGPRCFKAAMGSSITSF
jgi:hypothetical protein